MTNNSILTTNIKDVHSYLGERYNVEIELHNTEPIKEITWHLTYETYPWVVGGWLNRPDNTGVLSNEVLNNGRLEYSKNMYHVSWSGAGDITLTADDVIPAGSGNVISFLFGDSDQLQMNEGKGVLIIKEVTVTSVYGTMETIPINTKGVITIDKEKPKELELSNQNTNDSEEISTMKKELSVYPTVYSTSENHSSDNNDYTNIKCEVTLSETKKEEVVISLDNSGNSTSITGPLYINIVENNELPISKNEIYEYVYQKGNEWIEPTKKNINGVDMHVIEIDGFDEISKTTFKFTEHFNRVYMRVLRFNLYSSSSITPSSSTLKTQASKTILPSAVDASGVVIVEEPKLYKDFRAVPILGNYNYSYISNKYIYNKDETVVNTDSGNWINYIFYGAVDLSGLQLEGFTLDNLKYKNIKIAGSLPRKNSQFKNFKLDNSTFNNGLTAGTNLYLENLDLVTDLSGTYTVHMKKGTFHMKEITTSKKIILDNLKTNTLNNIYAPGINIIGCSGENISTLENINIKNSIDSTGGIYINKCYGVTVKGCTVDTTTDFGVNISESNNINVLNSQITNTGSSGVFVNKSNTINLQKNVFNNTNTNENKSQYVIYIKSDSTADLDVTNATENTFSSGKKVYKTEGTKAKLNVNKNILYLYNYITNVYSLETKWWRTGMNVQGEDVIPDILKVVEMDRLWNNLNTKIQDADKKAVYDNAYQHLCYEYQKGTAKFRVSISQLLYEVWNNRYTLRAMPNNAEIAKLLDGAKEILTSNL